MTETLGIAKGWRISSADAIRRFKSKSGVNFPYRTQPSAFIHERFNLLGPPRGFENLSRRKTKVAKLMLTIRPEMAHVNKVDKIEASANELPFELAKPLGMSSSRELLWSGQFWGRASHRCCQNQTYLRHRVCSRLLRELSWEFSFQLRQAVSVININRKPNPKRQAKVGHLTSFHGATWSLARQVNWSLKALRFQLSTIVANDIIADN